MQAGQSRFVRMAQLVGDKDANVHGLVPLSAATIWRMVKAGAFPAPVKLGKNSTAWRLSDVEAWVESRPAGTPRGKRLRAH